MKQKSLDFSSSATEIMATILPILLLIILLLVRVICPSTKPIMYFFITTFLLAFINIIYEAIYINSKKCNAPLPLFLLKRSWLIGYLLILVFWVFGFSVFDWTWKSLILSTICYYLVSSCVLAEFTSNEK
jgi:hypothetical protein